MKSMRIVGGVTLLGVFMVLAVQALSQCRSWDLHHPPTIVASDSRASPKYVADFMRRYHQVIVISIEGVPVAEDRSAGDIERLNRQYATDKVWMTQWFEAGLQLTGTSQDYASCMYAVGEGFKVWNLSWPLNGDMPTARRREAMSALNVYSEFLQLCYARLRAT